MISLVCAKQQEILDHVLNKSKSDNNYIKIFFFFIIFIIMIMWHVWTRRDSGAASWAARHEEQSEFYCKFYVYSYIVCDVRVRWSLFFSIFLFSDKLAKWQLLYRTTSYTAIICKLYSFFPSRAFEPETHQCSIDLYISLVQLVFCIDM